MLRRTQMLFLKNHQRITEYVIYGSHNTAFGYGSMSRCSSISDINGENSEKHVHKTVKVKTDAEADDFWGFDALLETSRIMNTDPSKSKEYSVGSRVPLDTHVPQGQNAETIQTISSGSAAKHATSTVPRGGYKQDTQQKSRQPQKDQTQSNIFDEQYFSSVREVNVGTWQNRSYRNDEINNVKDVTLDSESQQSSHNVTQSASENGSISDGNSCMSENPLSLKDDIDSSNFFDQEYFGDSAISPDAMQTTRLLDKNKTMLNNDLHMSEQSAKQQELSVRDDHETDSSNLFDEQYFSGTSGADHQRNINHSPQSDINLETLNSMKQTVSANAGDVVVMPVTKRNRRMKTQPKANIEEPQTAYDMAMKIRKDKENENSKTTNVKLSTESPPDPRTKWSGEVDTRGFRNLQSQVLNLEHLTSEVMVNILKDSVLYEDDKLVAIDKPYGLPSHGGPGVHHSVGKYLDELGQILNESKEKLHLVHRLDRVTTGVMLLAKSQQAYAELRGYFKRQDVTKIYYTITKGVPNPLSGVIDIPMAETLVQGKTRMGLRPDYNETTKTLMKRAKSVKKFPAVTEYKVLDQHGTAALVECRPLTGIKHQIRCHLAFGLNCPVLGDHKYSHFSKLAPQKLYPDILQRLGVRQAKVRHVPMHLHARTLILPEYRDGRNVFISARLPRHFVQNMKWLKVKPPKIKSRRDEN